MASSDAIVVGEDWISEHYFTTDATNESFQAEVLERRKDVGRRRRRPGTPRTRFTRRRARRCDRVGRPWTTAADDQQPTLRPTDARSLGSTTDPG